MAIFFRCQCGRTFNARDDEAGRSLQCPQCGDRLTVPVVSLRPEECDDDDPLLPRAPAKPGPFQRFVKALNTPTETKPSPQPTPEPTPPASLDDIRHELVQANRRLHRIQNTLGCLYGLLIILTIIAIMIFLGGITIGMR